VTEINASSGSPGQHNRRLIQYISVMISGYAFLLGKYAYLCFLNCNFEFYIIKTLTKLLHFSGSEAL